MFCDLSNKKIKLKKLRFIAYPLPNQDTYYFITNVEDRLVTSEDFADLYRGRWRVEEAFKQIKSHMHVENWSGFKKHVIEQDFYAVNINYNCAAIMVLASAPYEMQALGDAGNRKGKWLATIN